MMLIAAPLARVGQTCLENHLLLPYSLKTLRSVWRRWRQLKRPLIENRPRRARVPHKGFVSSVGIIPLCWTPKEILSNFKGWGEISLNVRTQSKNELARLKNCPACTVQLGHC